MPGTMDSKSWIEASESKNDTNNIVQIRVINDSPPPLPRTNLFVITLNHENHFYTSPDAPGLLQIENLIIYNVNLCIVVH